MSIIVSLDIGTSKICVLAYSLSDRIVLKSVSKDNNSLVRLLDKQYHEQSIPAILNIVFDSLKELLSGESVDAQSVSGVVVTGQMHGVLLVNGKFEPITNLITWRDGRSFEIANAIGTKFAASNGCGLRVGYGGATLAWLVQNQKLEAGFKALTIADYVCAVLTGKIATEPTHAASWGIYDLTKSQWNKETLNELSIPEEVLPVLCSTSEILGEIVPCVANEFGLNKQVKIYSSIGDNQASVIGARGQNLDAAVLNLGTGGQISIPYNSVESFDGFEVRPMLGNSYILVGASLCGGWAYAYLKDFFKAVVRDFASLELDDTNVYEKMNSYLKSSSKTNLCVVPRFCGTRDNANICGAITLIDTHNLNPSEITIAFATSMVSELGKMVPEKCYNVFSKVILSGNAVRKNHAILKIAHKYFGKPVEMANLDKEAAVGAVLASIKD
jgi:sedoheptulokinase